SSGQLALEADDLASGPVVALVPGLLRPGSQSLRSGGVDSLNPVAAVVILIGEADVSRQIYLVKGKLDALHVSPAQVELNLRFGKKDTRYADSHRRFDDVVNLIPRLIVVASLALLIFADQPAKQLKRLDEVGILLPLAVGKLSDAPGV